MADRRLRVCQHRTERRFERPVRDGREPHRAGRHGHRRRTARCGDSPGRRIRYSSGSGSDFRAAVRNCGSARGFPGGEISDSGKATLVVVDYSFHGHQPVTGVLQQSELPPHIFFTLQLQNSSSASLGPESKFTKQREFKNARVFAVRARSACPARPAGTPSVWPMTFVTLPVGYEAPSIGLGRECLRSSEVWPRDFPNSELHQEATGRTFRGLSNRGGGGS